MLKLSNSLLILPRYWWDTQAGDRIVEANPHDVYLKASVQDAEAVPVSYEDFHTIMIHRMCPELPEGSCTGLPDDADVPKVHRVTLAGLKSFLAAVTLVARSKLKGGTTHVSQAEADRRAFVCSRCPCNIPNVCTYCSGLFAMASVYLRGKELKSVNPKDIGACSVCECFLKALVWCPPEILKELPQHEYPDNCWRNDL